MAVVRTGLYVLISAMVVLVLHLLYLHPAQVTGTANRMDVLARIGGLSPARPSPDLC